MWFSELTQCHWWHFNFSQISSSSLDVHAWLIQISAANVNTDQKLVYGARCRYSNSSHLLLFLRLHFLTAMSISSLFTAQGIEVDKSAVLTIFYTQGRTQSNSLGLIGNLDSWQTLSHNQKLRKQFWFVIQLLKLNFENYELLLIFQIF